MNPYLPADKQNIDDIPLDDGDDCDTDRPMTEGEAVIARDLGAFLDQAERRENVDGIMPPHLPPRIVETRDAFSGMVVSRVVFDPPVHVRATDQFAIFGTRDRATILVSRDTSKSKILSKNGIMSVGSVTKKLIIGCAFAIVFLALLYIANGAFRKQELVTCNQLKSYSQKYIGFYLTKGEKQMCDSLGIAIYAPVK